MKLFQYWDSPSPPDQIAGWIEHFRINNPEFEHVLINKASALEFIAVHYGPREVSAFEACAVPAMQADYIRLCLLEICGGVYVDADSQSRRPLSELFKDCPGSVLFAMGMLVNNGFMYFPNARDPFVSACLKVATDNIHARRTNAVFTTAGPGVLIALRYILDPSTQKIVDSKFDAPFVCTWGFPDVVERVRELVEVTPELLEAFSAIDIMQAMDVVTWIGEEQPVYKQTTVHWTRWEGSIYNEVASE